MKFLARAVRFVIPAVLVVLAVGWAIPAKAGDNEGLKKRAGARVLVDQLYRDILARPADEGAYKLYANALEEGKSPDLVRKMIAFSPEAGIVINDRFKKFLGREATEAELQKARQELNQGATLDQVEARLQKMSLKKQGKHK